MFLDEVVIEVESGKGGDGAATFHREKHVPRGGPNGADGGRGGDVVFVADHHKRTLYDFSFQKHFKAEDGVRAMGNKNGKDGSDLTIHVPVGTQIYDAESGDLLYDLGAPGLRAIVCQGGKGGFGNLHYVSSVRQVPKFAQLGAPPENIALRLELKLLADVGLVGLPNAGKSTLIAAISAAKPKIGNYPFTTIEPNLGVVSVRDTTFVVADMPGLIEGASEGVGLGHQFLRHIERTRVLVHLVEVMPMDQSDPENNLETVEDELRQYSESVFSKPRIIALTKVELVDEEMVELLLEALAKHGMTVLPISAVTGQGIPKLLDEVVRLLATVETMPMSPIVQLATMQPAEEWDVIRTDGGFELTGKRLQRLVAMTNMQNEEAVMYLHRRLTRLGVIDRLRDMGAEEGDNVYCLHHVFSFVDEL